MKRFYITTALVAGIVAATSIRPTFADTIPITDCDKLTASADDPSRVADPTPFAKINGRRAISACKEALAQYPDTARFQFQLGRAYSSTKDMESAVVWWTKAAKQEYAAAALALGHYFNRDPSKVGQASKWFFVAAQQGHPLAQFNLGVAYMDGLGVDVDIPKAEEWYRKAAAQGNTDAKNNLAFLRQRREGVLEELFRYMISVGDCYEMRTISRDDFLARQSKVRDIAAEFERRQIDTNLVERDAERNFFRGFPGTRTPAPWVCKKVQDEIDAAHEMGAALPDRPNLLFPRQPNISIRPEDRHP